MVRAFSSGGGETHTVISAFGQSEIRKVACVRSDQHGAQLAGRRSPYSPSISHLTSRPKGEPGLEPRTKRRVEGHVLFLFQWHRRSGIDPHFNLAQPVVALRLQPLTPAWFETVRSPPGDSRVPSLWKKTLSARNLLHQFHDPPANCRPRDPHERFDEPQAVFARYELVDI